MADFYNYEATKKQSKFYDYRLFSGINVMANQIDEELSDTVYGQNIAMSYGRLSSAKGVKTAEVNGVKIDATLMDGAHAIYSAFFYEKYDYDNRCRDDRIIVMYENCEIYQLCLNNVEAGFVSTGITASSERVSFVNFHYLGKDCVLVFDDNGMAYMYDGEEITSNAEVPYFTSVCAHNGRLYGTENRNGKKVWFSEENAPLSWRTSSIGDGYIEFPDEGGAMQKIISHKNNLFIFRDYAVYKLTIYEDVDKYTITKILNSDHVIRYNTVAVCDDKITVLTDDAFLSYDGSYFRTVWSAYHKLIVNAEKACATYYGGYYVVCAKFYNDGTDMLEDGTDYVAINNGILMLGADKDTFSLTMGVDVRDFIRVVDNDGIKLLMRNNIVLGSYMGEFTQEGKIYNKATVKKWQSADTSYDFLKGEKYIKKIYFDCDAPGKLTVRLDKEYVYDVVGGNQVQTIPIYRKGDKIGLSFVTTHETFRLREFAIEFDLIERRNYE